MSSRTGMPRVGLLCRETSGLFLSRPPGVFSHATTPHMLPLHSATRILATSSATFQSPVGSAAKAAPTLAVKTAPQQMTVRVNFRGQCNMIEPMLNWDVEDWGQNAALRVFC